MDHRGLRAAHPPGKTEARGEQRGEVLGEGEMLLGMLKGAPQSGQLAHLRESGTAICRTTARIQLPFRREA